MPELSDVIWATAYDESGRGERERVAFLGFGAA